MLITKIATVKQECDEGDKVTIKGTVKWLGDVETHPGQENDFKTQSLLIADGVKAEGNPNSMFCGFYADKGSWNHLKGQEVTVQGTISIYQSKMSLRNCKLKEKEQPAPNQAQEPSSRAPESPKSISADTPEVEVRCSLVCTAIRSGQIKLTDNAIADLEYWKLYITTGRAPLPPSKIPKPDPSITEYPEEYT